MLYLSVYLRRYYFLPFLQTGRLQHFAFFLRFYLPDRFDVFAWFCLDLILTFSIRYIYTSFSFLSSVFSSTGLAFFVLF